MKCLRLDSQRLTGLYPDACGLLPEMARYVGGVARRDGWPRQIPSGSGLRNDALQSIFFEGWDCEDERIKAATGTHIGEKSWSS